jgi:hypothetical protein
MLDPDLDKKYWIRVRIETNANLFGFNADFSADPLVSMRIHWFQCGSISFSADTQHCSCDIILDGKGRIPNNVSFLGQNGTVRYRLEFNYLNNVAICPLAYCPMVKTRYSFTFRDLSKPIGNAGSGSFYYEHGSSNLI